jgi:hypothetical protein
VGLRRVVLLAVAACALALAGCGPSAGQVREAREARYHGERAEVFRLVFEAVAEDHAIEAADPASAQLLTKGRWYEAGGNLEDTETQPSGEDAVILHHGSMLLAFAVAVVGDEPSVQVMVKPVVDQWLVGATSLKRMELDDPDVPGWVEVRADELQIAIHKRLKQQLTVAPGAAASPSPGY